MVGTDPVRVLVVDDDTLVRDALRSFFIGRHDYEVVAEAGDGVEGIEQYALTRPDIVLMDLQMPRVSGVEATRRIIGRWPDACIVAITTFGAREYVVAALRAGASGYLLKDTSGTELLAALAQARAGDMPLSSAVRRELVSTLTHGSGAPPASDSGLTPREVELTQWLAHGLTNSQIATRMHLSEGSVKQYLNRISDKFGVSSRTQVLVRSIQLGIVDPAALPPLGS